MCQSVCVSIRAILSHGEPVTCKVYISKSIADALEPDLKESDIFVSVVDSNNDNEEVMESGARVEGYHMGPDIENDPTGVERCHMRPDINKNMCFRKVH